MIELGDQPVNCLTAKVQPAGRPHMRAMASEDNDHLAIYAAESAALAPTEWEQWATVVEDALGLTGVPDGAWPAHITWDDLYDLWKSGLATAGAVERLADGTLNRQVRGDQ